MTTYELPRAGTVTTFQGVSSRAADPFRRWRSLWGDGYQEIEPKFSEESHRDRVRQEAVVGDWSGIAICRANRKTVIQAVEATWVVPNCYPPDGAQKGQRYTASFWIGIDGDGQKGDKSSDILQIGVDCDVVAGESSRSALARAWWEWAPGASHWIRQFPIAPGDTLHGVIQVVSAAAGARPQAAVSLHNRTSAIAASFMIEPIEHVELTGNCAEWIVERIPPGLARYGAVWFDGAKAFLQDGKEIGPELSGELSIPYEIPGEKKEVISRGYVLSKNLVRCAYGGTDTMLNVVGAGR